MPTPTLNAIQGESNALLRNRLLFEALRDDAGRSTLYAQLKQSGFPPLPFTSVMRRGGKDADKAWPDVRAWLVTSAQDVSKVLRQGSVKPYAQLESGGSFMLGQDELSQGELCPHRVQRNHALCALKFDEAERLNCAREAVRRAMVLPTKTYHFDLVADVAEQAALRYIALLFGLTAKAHVYLQLGMRAGYTRLTFQIIGRHFLPDDGLAPSDSKNAVKIRDDLYADILGAAHDTLRKEWWDENLLTHRNASLRLAADYPQDDEMLRIVISGLMVGTVGNVTSAIANTIDYFFCERSHGVRLIDMAVLYARANNGEALRGMIEHAMRYRPPAPFLTRTAKHDMLLGSGKDRVQVRAGDELVLAMGADLPIDPELMFGGALNDGSYVHSCVGRHLAWPIIEETVRSVLLLPGLSQRIDPANNLPMPLAKSWGAICDEFPLQYQRDRRLNQQPLLFVLKIKEPVAENARKLMLLTKAGAAVVERALEEAHNVHFAWFLLVENCTHLAFFTVYDGDFDAYVEHFALRVPLFDEQFKYLVDAPPTPIQLYPKEFVQTIKDHNRTALVDYFYSAYPTACVADIQNLGLGPR
ncbi:MAG: hypothetical protein JSS14_04910 [Proteobacteria bacterium]|nr:hypothetical protein [Pseudomonadota bacterium]